MHSLIDDCKEIEEYKFYIIDNIDQKQYIIVYFLATYEYAPVYISKVNKT